MLLLCHPSRVSSLCLTLDAAVLPPDCPEREMLRNQQDDDSRIRLERLEVDIGVAKEQLRRLLSLGSSDTEHLQHRDAHVRLETQQRDAHVRLETQQRDAHVRLEQSEQPLDPKMLELIGLLDADGDGSITREEFADGLLASQMQEPSALGQETGAVGEISHQLDRLRQERASLLGQSDQVRTPHFQCGTVSGWITPRLCCSALLFLGSRVGQFGCSYDCTVRRGLRLVCWRRDRRQGSSRYATRSSVRKLGYMTWMEARETDRCRRVYRRDKWIS